MARAGYAVLSKEDLKIQKQIIQRADRSLAILGRSFVRNGSGIFLNVRSTPSGRHVMGVLKKIKKKDAGMKSACRV